MKFKGENEEEFELGGLQFWVGYREDHEGTTTRVIGTVDGTATELLRFDDFLDKAHYHVPANARDANGRAIEIPFDRSTMGEARSWYIGQIRDHLAELLTTAGYETLLPGIDFEAISQGIDRIDGAMDACLPASIVRVPGKGLQRVS